MTNETIKESVLDSIQNTIDMLNVWRRYLIYNGQFDFEIEYALATTINMMEQKQEVIRRIEGIERGSK